MLRSQLKMVEGIRTCLGDEMGVALLNTSNCHRRLVNGSTYFVALEALVAVDVVEFLLILPAAQVDSNWISKSLVCRTRTLAGSTPTSRPITAHTH